MRPGRRDLLALLAAVALAAVAVAPARLWIGTDPELATLWQGWLASAGLVVPLLGALCVWWWRGRRPALGTADQLDAAADALATSTAAAWTLQARHRGLTAPAPVPVAWEWSEDAGLPPHEVFARPVAGTGVAPLPQAPVRSGAQARPGSPPALRAGVITRLHDEVYAHLGHGQLVVLGGPGAGKTGALLMLLLAALHRRAAQDDPVRRGRVPVPVWLSAGEWDPAATPLLDWAAAALERDHPWLRSPQYGPHAARRLLQARPGRVALFLDGLDEMTASLRGPALTAVDREAAGLRVVLTSRTEEYRQARLAGALSHPAVVELRPVPVQDVAAYLSGGHDGADTRRRWEQLAEVLSRQPDGVLARALDSPLALSLARSAYAGRDPAELLDPARFPEPALVRGHLVERFLHTAYPDERERDHAVRWLGWAAHHLGRTRELAWWRIPTWIPARRFRTARGLVAGLLMGSGYGLVAGPVAGIAAALVAGLLYALADARRDGPRRLRLRRPARRDLAEAARLALVGAVASAGAGALVLGSGSWWGAALGFALGAVVAGALALVFRSWGAPVQDAARVTPGAAYRDDRRYVLVGGAAVGLAFAVAVAIPTGAAAGLATGLRSGAAVGLVCWAVVALTAGASTGVWVTQLVLRWEGRGRVRLVPLLEEALARQVLRQAGAVYQFRHAELQDLLAALHRDRPPRVRQWGDQNASG